MQGEAADEARDVYAVFSPFVYHFVGEQGEVCEGGVEDLGGGGWRGKGREGRINLEEKKSDVERREVTKTHTYI